MRSVLSFRLLPPALLLALGACNSPMIQPGNENALAQNSVEQPLSPGLRAVTIGESGPSFAACGARGTILGSAGGDDLPLRAAPFENSDQVATLATGTQVFVCTRSIDQRWLGVVVQGPEGTPDCGVTRRVAAARPYDGPCASGWIASAYARLSAG